MIPSWLKWNLFLYVVFSNAVWNAIFELSFWFDNSIWSVLKAPDKNSVTIFFPKHRPNNNVPIWDVVENRPPTDSLKVNFGNPTLSKDTTIFLSLNEKNQIKQKIWKGNKIKMVYEFDTSWGDNISRLQVIDISAENILDSISEKIDSLSILS